jgi:hypothetical protein
MRVIFTERQINYIKKLLKEGVDPESYLKIFLDVIGVSTSKTSSEITQALTKNPVEVKIKNVDGGYDVISCKSLDELIIATQRLAKSEIDFESGIRIVAKENPKLKSNFTNAIIKGDFDDLMTRYYASKATLTNQKVKPDPISNDLPKQVTAENDIEQILTTKLSDIQKRLEETIGTENNPKIKLNTEDINLTKEKLKENLLKLYNFKTANELFTRRLNNLFSKFLSGVYEAGSVDYTNIEKLIKDFNDNTLKVYDDAITDLTKFYNQIDEINVKKASNEESPVVNNSGPRNDLNDDDLMDLLSPNADFTYKFSPLRFGFDLNSIEGELKSSDFNEDFINWTNLSVEEPPPASSSILGEEIGSYRDWLAIQIKGGPQPDFVEHDLMAQMLKNIRQGLSWIKSGQLQSGLGYLPKSGFERYGVDDFRAFIKKAYEENRLLINTDKNIPSDIDNDPERLRWTIEVRPTPGKTVIDINKLRDMDLYDNMEVDKNRFGVNYNRDAIKVPSVSKTIDIDVYNELMKKIEKSANESKSKKNNVFTEIKRLKNR